MSDKTVSIPEDQLVKIAEICERVAMGDLEGRLFDMNEHPALASICNSINKMIDTNDAYLREASAMINNYNTGRFHRPILMDGFHGVFESTARAIGTAGLNMKESKEQMNLFLVWPLRMRTKPTWSLLHVRS